MAKRTAPKITTSTPLGRTVDLAQETVCDKAGRPIDADYVEELVEAARKTPGRPSLAKGTSPSVAFRLSPELRARAAEVPQAKARPSPNSPAKHSRPAPIVLRSKADQGQAPLQESAVDKQCLRGYEFSHRGSRH